MSKLVHILACLLLCTSCAEQYNIAGNSSLASLDGRMLYLRVEQNGVYSDCLDSCEVIHGRFSFMGDVDSVVLAHLFMGEQRVMPLVIENGNLTVQMDNIMQRVSGGPLNDRLYGFFQRKAQLENDLWEVEQRTLYLMQSGRWSGKERDELTRKSKKLARKVEDLETDFVVENSDNVLGPSLFMLLCRQYPTPVMTEQIDRIIHRAPDAFLRHPFVRNYVEEAQRRRRVRDTLDLEP